MSSKRDDEFDHELLQSLPKIENWMQRGRKRKRGRPKREEYYAHLEYHKGLIAERQRGINAGLSKDEHCTGDGGDEGEDSQGGFEESQGLSDSQNYSENSGKKAAKVEKPLLRKRGRPPKIEADIGRDEDSGTVSVTESEDCNFFLFTNHFSRPRVVRVAWRSQQ